MAWVKYRTLSGKRYAQWISIDKETGGIHYGMHVTQRQYVRSNGSGMYVKSRMKKHRLSLTELEGWRKATTELRASKQRGALLDNDSILSYWGNPWKTFAPRYNIYRHKQHQYYFDLQS